MTTGTPAVCPSRSSRTKDGSLHAHRDRTVSSTSLNQLAYRFNGRTAQPLVPRCRLIASWGCSRSQGLGCSPIKAVRELGSERRETVRSLSVAGVGDLKRAILSTRGPGWTHRWCTSCHANGIAG